MIALRLSLRRGARVVFAFILAGDFVREERF
jgi:hypothetical protein